MKRFSALLFATSLSVWSFAQEAATTLAGTKPDIVVNQPAQPQPVVNGFQFVQMIVAVAIVLGLLKFVLPRVVGKVGKGLHTGLNSSIRVEESATFAAGQLHIVSARGKAILIAVTPQGVTTLADLTEVPTSPQQTEEPAFFELMDQAKSEPEEVLRDRAVVEIFEGEDEEAAGETVDLTSLLQAAREKMASDEAAPKPASGSAKRQAASKAYGSTTEPKNSSEELSPEELKKRLDRLSKLIG